MRVGVIGYGAIGRHVVDHVLSTNGCELSFLQTRSPIADAPKGVTVTDALTAPLLAATDLVVEAAHPEIITRHGHEILASCDLMVVSAGGLVDDAERTRLIEQAQRNGTRIIVPFGALAGLDALASRPGRWTDATITFVKPPTAFEPAPAETGERFVIYDGPVRGIAARYPRNVNAMVTFALATAGLDATRALLISDPQQPYASLKFQAHASDGGRLQVTKSQPLLGVSGSEMPDAIAHSLRMRTGGAGGLWFG